MTLELARTVVNREILKQECVKQGLRVWEKQHDLVELKRKFPSLGDKANEELLYDKERVPKHPKTETS
jgi:enhancer of polycomb-like protein